MVNKKLITYFLISVYLIVMLITMSDNDGYNTEQKQMINEKLILFQVKSIEGVREFLKADDRGVEELSEVLKHTIKPPDSFSNAILLLHFTVILDFLDQKDEALYLIKKLKETKTLFQKVKHEEIISLLSNIIQEKNIKPKDYPTYIIKETFTKKWYRQHILSKYYKLTNNIDKMDIIDSQIKSSAVSFFKYIIVYSLFFLFAFIIGIVLFVIQITKLKRIDKPISGDINYLVDGYGIFILWFSVSITISFLLHRLFPSVERDLFYLFISYLLSVIAGIYIINFFLAKSGISIKSFIKENMYISYEKVIKGLKGYFLAFPIVILLGLISSIFFMEENPKTNYIFSLFPNDNTIISVILIFFMSSIIAPIFEELLFRGVIFSLFRKRLGFMGAAFVSGLLFGIVHLDLNLLISISGLGILLAWVYEESGSLVSPIITHSIWNTAVLIGEVFLYYNT